MRAGESKKYETRPLSCFGRAKELRAMHYQDVREARSKGKLLIVGGSAGLPQVLASGIGPMAYLGGEEYAGAVGIDPTFSKECLEAVEARGFARDLCGYTRNFWGSMFLDRYVLGGRFPRPDFCLQMHGCDTMSKWFQQVSEHFDIPFFAIEWPFARKEGSNELNKQYLIYQMNELIEWMQKITGRPYDDERLLVALRNDCEVRSLWGEICTLNKTIPAPLDHKTMFPLFIVSVIMRHEDEAVEFYRMARDEIKWRVDNQIAAIPVERCRIIDDNEPPWFFLHIFRHMEKYGAVSLGSHHTFFLAGAFEENADATLSARRTPAGKGREPRNRQEALNVLAEWYLDWPLFDAIVYPDAKRAMLFRMVKEWNADAVLLHLNRGCEALTQGVAEDRLALAKAGIPVGTYESNMVDPREMNMAQVLDRVDAFMESLGLAPIN